MRYCSTRLRSLLCYIKNFVIEEFVIRVLHCTYLCVNCAISSSTYMAELLLHLTQSSP